MATLTLERAESISLDRHRVPGILVVSVSLKDGGFFDIHVPAADEGAAHPCILVGRGVEVAWVHGLNEGDPDDAPHCDRSTTVARREDNGVLEIRTDEDDYEVQPHQPS